MGYVLVYNVFFIMPLLAVFAGTYAGVRSQMMAQLFKEHLAAAKFVLAAVFIVLAVLLWPGRIW